MRPESIEYRSGRPTVAEVAGKDKAHGTPVEVPKDSKPPMLVLTDEQVRSTKGGPRGGYELHQFEYYNSKPTPFAQAMFKVPRTALITTRRFSEKAIDSSKDVNQFITYCLKQKRHWRDDWGFGRVLYEWAPDGSRKSLLKIIVGFENLLLVMGGHAYKFVRRK